ncbi:MAG: TonB-dependent receptor [Dysgonamonadaceae bacterium]|nr:TonB-dependent receptor [Dysgonamonadaceae bacterium]
MYIRGTVADETGEALIGVTVKIKNNEKNVVLTDVDGKFGITVSKPEDILVFTYIGYSAAEMKVDPSKPMIVVMKEDSKYLDEIVVIGYQDVRRRDLTGSVGKANLDDMLKAPVPSFDQALAGRLAGVQVSSGEGIPGGVMNIVIRGNNSLTQENSPLYVIDGFPIEDPAVGASINPNDIESLDVLKDASATAIYGARGANGVVMITTKKGKVGAPQVSYDFNAGVSRISNKIKLMDAYEFVRLQSEIYTTADMIGDFGYFQTHNGKTYTLDDYRNVPQYDWQDMIFRDAWQQSHNLSLTGGTTEARYNASFSYFDQDGIVLHSNYNKMQGRLGFNVKKSKLNTNFSVNYNKSVSTGASPSQSSYSGMNNLFYSVWGYRPVTQPNVELNSLINNIRDEGIETLNDYRFNPIMDLQNSYRKNFITYLQFNGFAEYEFAKGIRLKISGGYITDNRRNETFNNSKTRYGYPGSTSGVNATLAVSERMTWLNENTVSYNKTIDKKHNISAVAGITLQESQYKYNSETMNQIPFESLGMTGMKQGQFGNSSSLQQEEALFSYLGRVNYNYASKYYFTGSMRADGSSKFDENNRWGYFPSTSIAWAFSEESFFEELKKTVSSGKFRFGWGETGNNRIGPYDRYALLDMLRATDGNYTTSSGIAHGVYPIDNNANSVGVVPRNLPNKNLKWETTTQTNIGFDLTLLKERINITADWYNKVTSDLLFFTELTLSSGYAGAMRNIGKVRNRGFEFTINTTNINRKDFKWSTNFNISFNRNKVLDLAEGVESKTTIATFDQNFNATPSYIAKVGLPIGMMYGYVYEGTYKTDEFDFIGGNYVLKPGIPHYSSEVNTQPGYPKYRDINNDGVIDSNDRSIIGRGEPKHIGGITNNFEYKGFDLGIFFQWSYGNNILNANRLMFENGFNKKKDLNQFASYADRWTFDNPDSNIPRVNTSSSNLVFSSRVIEDGSYLRLKTLSFGYTLPSNVLKNMHISKAHVYVAAQNLITFTNYSGYDPEVSIRNSALTPGLDFSAYPRSASLTFGINLNF